MEKLYSYAVKAGFIVGFLILIIMAVFGSISSTTCAIIPSLMGVAAMLWVYLYKDHIESFKDIVSLSLISSMITGAFAAAGYHLFIRTLPHAPSIGWSDAPTMAAQIYPVTGVHIFIVSVLITFVASMFLGIMILSKKVI